MKNHAGWICLAYCGAALSGSETHAEVPAALPAPKYTITLGGRDACVTPRTSNRTRADGGIIDVQVSTSSPGAVTVSMTGTPAADSYLACTSTASQTFHLVQEFEVTCSDPSVRTVVLAIDSTLAGYVRSSRKASASVTLARASVTPDAWQGTPLAQAHPPLASSGTEARLCNQHLPLVEGPPMPLGRFTLVADFVLDATASGLCNATRLPTFPRIRRCRPIGCACGSVSGGVQAIVWILVHCLNGDAIQGDRARDRKTTPSTMIRSSARLDLDGCSVPQYSNWPIKNSNVPLTIPRG